MITSLSLPEETSRERAGSRAAVMGVARRWPFQQAAAIRGVTIAVDADLLNQRELSEYLASRNLATRQMSFAELLAWLYLVDGPGFVQRLDGAFSVALWDEREQRLLLAIDRLGLRSIYWRREGDRLLFASR